MRKRKTVAQLNAEGSWRAGDSKRGRDIVALPSEPGKPSRNLDEVGWRTWDATTERLRSMELLSSADTEAVTRYAELTSLWTLCLAEIKKSGFFVQGRSGSVAASPATRLLDQIAGRLVQLESALGLSPGARTRMAVMAPPTKGKTEDEDVDDFFARRGKYAPDAPRTDDAASVESEG